MIAMNILLPLGRSHVEQGSGSGASRQMLS